jgi:ubiquinone/menaquinone biosynthesis C-methylase UbiE
MSTHQRRVDYDDIASTYDARYRSQEGEGQHTIPPALRELLRPGVRYRILEVGCGTGFWLGSFGSGHDVFGIDLSQGMLSRAKLKQTNLVCGTADQLPFTGGSFDLVYCVNALHHFVQKEVFIREASRLLRRGGAIAIIGMDPHGQRDRWYIYDYFAGTYEADLLRFPSISQITAWLAGAGFSDVRDCVVERIMNHQYSAEVLNHPVLQKNGTSQLILLSDEAYEDGLERLKSDLDEAAKQGRKLVFPEDISLAIVTARRA